MKFGPPSIPVFQIGRKERKYRQCYFQDEFTINDEIGAFEDFEVYDDDEPLQEEEDQQEHNLTKAQQSTGFSDGWVLKAHLVFCFGPKLWVLAYAQPEQYNITSLTQLT